MDRQIEIKNKKTKKMLLWGIPIVLLVGIIFLNLTRKKQVNLKIKSLSIKSVIEGDFEDITLFDAVVEPKTSVLVNVIQGGAVAEIFAESGMTVKKGTPLLKLHNPNAELNYLTQETAIIEQINNLRNLRVQVTNQKLNLAQQLLQIDNDFNTSKREFTINSKLYKKGVIAKNDYEKFKQNFQYQKERSGVIKKSVDEENKSRDVQLARINSSLSNMEKSLNLLIKNKENFVIKASSDGLLSSFNPILGQNYNQGQSVGKIDVLDGYKLVATIDEFYISKIKLGVLGEIYDNQNTYKIMVSKVYPDVVSGSFTIELSFTSDIVPTNIKRGMSFNSKLFLSGSKKSLLIEKGLFQQSTYGKWVFVYDENKQTAVKRNVELGRENPYYYEVVSGLKVGEKIITSDYENFKDVELLNIINNK